MQICASLALRLDTFYLYTHSTLGKSVGQDFLSRHFSFDLMICIDHGLQCAHSIWLMPSLALAKSDDILSYHPLHADKEFKYRRILHRTVYSEVLSATLY